VLAFFQLFCFSSIFRIALPEMTDLKPTIPETAPFSAEQARQLGALLASFSPDQSIWLEGFLGGLRSASAQPAAAAAAPAPAAALTVLYGSESGNAESLAAETAKAAEKAGFKPEVMSMADAKPERLKGCENLLVLVSTWGEGDPPENAVDFHAAFMGDRAPRLDGTRFSVLALGDTSYEHFCQTGRDFDRRLEELGALRVFPRRDCDVDFDEDFAAWRKGALEALGAAAPAAPAGAAATAAAAPKAPVKYSRKNPYPSELLERICLNGEGSAKETLHLEFSLDGDGPAYEVGDALAVIPHNAADVVDDLLGVLKLDPESPVNLKEGEFGLREALTSQLDITALSLPILKRYAEFAGSDELNALIEPENKAKLQEYLYGRELIDLLHDFPARALNADAVAALLRKLPPRLYSIASSPKAHPGEVHLTVGVVRYDSHGRQRKGVCSTYLADRIAVGEKAGVFVAPNKNFKLPADPDRPVIMIGPGTGIAPFRAFVEERKATGAKGKNWLFFGDQHFLTDFLYQLEWQAYLKEGVLDRLDLAFSRDQAHKIYVQDRMRERSKEIYAWLEEGAYFYVCGDATRMAVDVDEALHAIIEKEGGRSREEAAGYVKALKGEKRYLRDVY
jgi:sulfite reductase (NADPH) flavoprotein alpha-component